MNLREEMFNRFLDMETTTRKFLLEANLPEYAITLLELYGVSHVSDLIGFGREEIAELELKVRDRSIFPGNIDFEAKSSRKKYLGFDYSLPEQFGFSPLVKKKLLLLDTRAAESQAQKAVKKR